MLFGKLDYPFRCLPFVLSLTLFHHKASLTSLGIYIGLSTQKNPGKNFPGFMESKIEF